MTRQEYDALKAAEATLALLTGIARSAGRIYEDRRKETIEMVRAALKDAKIDDD